MMVFVMNAFIVFLSSNWLGILLTACILSIICFWGIPCYRAFSSVPVRSLPSVSFFRLLVDAIKFKGQSHLQFDQYYKKYGRNFSMFFGKLSVVVVNKPAMLKDIFVKEFQSFHDRPTFVSKLVEPFDSMMVLASGETWHRIRTTISPSFSAHRMKLMIPLMNRSCDLLQKKLDQVAGTGETIDIYRYFQALTIESILAAFFGLESNAQNDYNDPAFSAARECLQLGTFQRIVLSMALIIPGGSLILEYFPWILAGHFSSLLSLTKKIVEEKKKGSLVSGNKDFLDLMLSKTQPQGSANDARLTENEVIAQSFAFLMAGYDTTSNVLAILTHHLATNPDVQEKLQKEIDEVWSEEDQPPSYEVVQSLPYLDMVISEILRLYPPGFIVTRTCTRDCVIQDVVIKKGEIIISLPYSLHRDPHFFPEPDRFDPERFSTEGKASRDPYTFFYFGHGPRNCIGMRFAQMEMKLALVRILKRFTLVVAPETRIPPVIRLSSTLGCTEGIKLRITNR